MLDVFNFNPISYTIHCLKKHSKKIIFLLSIDSVALAIMTVLPPYILKNIIYSFSVAVSYENLLFLIKYNVIIYFLFFLISFILWRMYDYYVDVKTFPQMKKEIILEVFFHTIQQSKSFFQKNYSGDIVEKIDELQDNVISIIQWFFGKMLYNIISVLFIASSLLYCNFICGVITLVWITGIIFMSYFFAKKIAIVSIDWVNNSSLLNGILVDVFSHSLIVKFFNNYEKEKTIIEEQTNKIAKDEKAIKFYFFLAWLIYSFSFLIVQIMSFYFLMQQYKVGKINSSDFAFVWSINSALVNILWRFLRDFSVLPKHYFSIQESLKILTEKIIIYNNKEKNLKVTEGKIVFENVSFNFDDKNQIFKNLSITIEKNQKVALVGYSGSGKTTFLNLLLRLHDIQFGKITIDNQIIEEVSLESLYKNITLIPQESGLFNRRIIDNIMYDSHHVFSKNNIDKAIEFSLLKDFIDLLPEKELTFIGEKGSKISGGQKQRIAIARAYLKNAPILILDEATSNLDSITEMKIQSNLETMMKNKTVLVVAHRLSTIKKMDRILVFHKGQIVQDGSHDILIHQEGIYRDLWKVQSNLIEDTDEKF